MPMDADPDTGEDGLSLEQRFIRHLHFAYRTAYAVLGQPAGAEEVIQDAFLTLMKRRKAYDPGRPFPSRPKRVDCC